MSQQLADSPIVPVVAIEDPAKAVDLCLALQRGGINAIEVTLRTEKALEAIANIKANCPDMYLGVGTILTPNDVDAAKDVGAEFLVSPALSPKLQTALEKCGILTLPGTATPSEALRAYDAGFKIVKLFPAGAVGGANLLKSILAPMPLIRFMPTGGVRISNVMDYYSLPNVIAVGGTWVANKDDINAGNWDKIEANAKEAMAVVAAG